jgi:hypothetical protein
MKGDHRGERQRECGWIIALSVLIAGGTAVSARGDLPIEQEPINYLSSPVDDPVARLQKRIDRGEVVLKHEEKQGYLKSVLEHLKVAPESQALVFSKTSFQHTRIAPRTPRALYFNDDVYVGYVKGGDVLEFASVDPKQGTVFYLLDQAPSGKPVFQRETHTCLQCHQSPKTKEVPGVLIRSIYPNRVGTPIFSAGGFVTDHESPMEERWGGWYVTGTHGDQRHMGNTVMKLSTNPEPFDREVGANVTELKDLVDTWPYLTGHSDIVALMVLEHQTQMHNLITRAGFEARIAMYQEAGINQALGRPPGSVSETTRRRINSQVEKLVQYMLFAGEPRLTSPVKGTSGFAESFAASGPRDHRGRSLREFDLKQRLFRYPCSFLIESESFDALPALVKDQVYRRLKEILTGRDPGSEFAHLTPDDRRAIFEILSEIKRDLPDDWKTTGKAG